MKKAPLLLVLTIVLLSGNCSERERLNPLDPLNPFSGGKPAAVKLTSDKRTVFIRWDELDIDGIKGFNLWRKTTKQEIDSLHATLPADSTQMEDSIHSYDVPYTYRLSVISDSWQSTPSDPESIIPGPFNYWIADFWGGTLSKLTYDGAHLLLQDISYFPIAVEFDHYNNSVWVASHYPNQIIKLDLKGQLLFSHSLDFPPVDIGVDEVRGNLFAVTLNSSSLIHLNAMGEQLEPIPCNVSFSSKARIAIDDSSGTIWLTEPDSGIVVRVIPESPGDITVFSGFSKPRTITSMPSLGLVWIATDSGVFSIDKKDGIDRYLENWYIIDLDDNDIEEEVWGIAYDSIAKVWSIFKIDQISGNWQITTLEVGKYRYMSRLRVNPGSEHPGLLLYNEFNRQIIRIDFDGNEIGSYGDFSYRIDIAIEE